MENSNGILSSWYLSFSKWRIMSSPLIILVIIVCCSGCNRYVIYKTAVRNSQVAYQKLAKHQKAGREFVLSAGCHEYIVEDLVVDTLEIKAILSAHKTADALFYHPQENLSDKRGHIRYNKKADSSALLQQVFIVADSITIAGNSLVIPLASVHRIDRVRKNQLVKYYLLLNAALLVVLCYVAVTGTAEYFP